MTTKIICPHCKKRIIPERRMSRWIFLVLLFFLFLLPGIIYWAIMKDKRMCPKCRMPIA